MSREQRADVSFTSTARAEEITFLEAPETRVDFSGDTDERSTSGSERTHLPNPVAPGTTYRDIKVNYRIMAFLSRRSPGG